jgi:hypothetical protein
MCVEEFFILFDESGSFADFNFLSVGKEREISSVNLLLHDENLIPKTLNPDLIDHAVLVSIFYRVICFENHFFKFLIYFNHKRDKRFNTLGHLSF